MPSCSGLDLLRYVRSNQGLCNMPVISEQGGEKVCRGGGSRDMHALPGRGTGGFLGEVERTSVSQRGREVEEVF